MQTSSPLALALALLSASPCLAGPEAWPIPRWETAEASDQGWDAAKLDAALDDAGRKHSRAVVVVHQGRIVAERYWDDWTAETAGPLHSATKSVIATLVGIALDEGLLRDLDQPAAELLPEWRGRPQAAITLRHLLTMTSGLELGQPGRMILRGALARDERAFATGLDQAHPPGTVWGYHNPAYRLLFHVLSEAADQPLPDFARERLFAPLGMQHAQFARKRRGKQDLKSLSASARDLARFGLLVLRGGRWGDRQLVSAEFLTRATQPSQTLNPSYGFLFWLNAGAQHRLPTHRYDDPPSPGRLLPDCPPDLIAALGAQDQKCYVIPSHDLVIVRLGEAASRGRFAASEFDNPFVGAVCAAAPRPR